MARIDAVIIRRSDRENTVALVSAECDPDMIQSSDDLYGAIARAVTRWAAQSAAGRSLLAANRGDLNIGDLRAYGVDRRLRNELRKEGVTGLTIDCHVGAKTAWDYDENLYDEATL